MNTKLVAQQNLVKVSKKSAKFKKTFLLFIVLFLPLCSIFLIISFFSNQTINNNLGFNKDGDNVVFSISDFRGNPITQAIIEVNNSIIGSTNLEGELLVNKAIAEKDSLFKVTKDGFEEFSGTVTDIRENILSVRLLDKGKYTIYGNFVVKDNTSYTFDQEILTINEQNIKLSRNGFFELNNFGENSVDIYLQSSNFTDIELQLDLQTGYNFLKNIELSPAGEIIGKFTNYINDEILDNVKIEIEGVLENQISQSNGNFRIRDLIIGRTYPIKISKEGFDTRNYNITIVQGTNIIKDLRMVPNGFISFFGIHPQNKNNPTLYISNLDGFNPIAIFETNNQNTVPLRKWDSKSSTLYFLSNFERLGRNRYGNFLPVYTFDLRTNSRTLLSKNYSEFEKFFVNFEADLILNLVQSSVNRKLFLQNLEGNKIEEIRSLTNQDDIRSILIPNTGIFIYFVEQDSQEHRLYAYNILTQEFILLDTNSEINIFSVNKDGKKILYERNTQNGLKELVLFTIQDRKFIIVRQNLRARNIVFSEGNENKIFFISDRLNRSNISEIDLETNVERIILNYNLNDPIQYFYQQDQYIVYGNSANEYIFDINKPVLNKLVRPIR